MGVSIHATPTTRTPGRNDNYIRSLQPCRKSSRMSGRAPTCPSRLGGGLSVRARPLATQTPGQDQGHDRRSRQVACPAARRRWWLSGHPRRTRSTEPALGRQDRGIPTARRIARPPGAVSRTGADAPTTACKPALYLTWTWLQAGQSGVSRRSGHSGLWPAGSPQARHLTPCGRPLGHLQSVSADLRGHPMPAGAIVEERGNG